MEGVMHSCVSETLMTCELRGIDPEIIFKTGNFDENLYWIMAQYVVGFTSDTNSRDLYEKFFTQIWATHFKMVVTPAILKNWRKHHEITVRLINKQIAKLDPRIDRRMFIITLCYSCFLIGQDEQSYISLMILQQDMYCMARLFSIFPRKSHHSTESIPSMCRNSPRVSHAILYTGTGHTSLYMEFLYQYFGIVAEHYVENADYAHCIKFDKPFDFYEHNFL
jgi:hypothetical protein